jgi:5-methylcytosine-specific restriction protein A
MVERLRGRAGQDQRLRRLKRTHHLCERCLCINRWSNRTSPRTEVAKIVNHIIPLARGGSDDDENTENLCIECDQIVTAEQFGHKQRVSIGTDGWPIPGK